MPEITELQAQFQALQAERAQLRANLSQHYTSLRRQDLAPNLQQQIERRIGDLELRSRELAKREETLMSQLYELVVQTEARQKLGRQRAVRLKQHVLDMFRHGALDEHTAAARLRSFAEIRRRSEAWFGAQFGWVDRPRLQAWHKLHTFGQLRDNRGVIVRQATDPVLEGLSDLYDRRSSLLDRAGELVDLQSQASSLLSNLPRTAEIPSSEVLRQAEGLANQATRLGVTLSPVPAAPTAQELRTYLYSLKGGLAGQIDEAFRRAEALALQADDLQAKRQQHFHTEGATAEEITVQKEREGLQTAREATGDVVTDILEKELEAGQRSVRSRVEEAALRAGIPLERLADPGSLTPQQLEHLRAELRLASPTEALNMLLSLSWQPPQSPGALWQSRIGQNVRVQGFGSQSFRIVGVSDKGVIVEPWTIAPEQTRVTVQLTDTDMERLLGRPRSPIDPLELPRATIAEEPMVVDQALAQATWWRQLLDEGETAYKEVRPVWRQRVTEHLGGIKIPEHLMRYIESETSWLLTGNVHDLEDAAQSVFTATMEMAAEQGIAVSTPEDLVGALGGMREGLLARYFRQVMQRQGTSMPLSREEQAISRLTQQVVAEPGWRSKSSKEIETEVIRRVELIRNYMSELFSAKPEEAARIRERLGYLSGVLDVTTADIHTYFEQGFAERIISESPAGDMSTSEPGNIQAVARPDDPLGSLVHDEVEDVPPEFRAKAQQAIELGGEEAGQRIATDEAKYAARDPAIIAVEAEDELAEATAQKLSYDMFVQDPGYVRQLMERAQKSGRIDRTKGIITFATGDVSPADVRAFLEAGLTVEVQEVDKQGNIIRTFTPEIPRGEEASYRKPLVVLRSGEWSAVMGEGHKQITLPTEAAEKTLFLSTGLPKPVLPAAVQQQVPFYWDIPVGSRAEYVAPGAALTPTDVHTTQHFLQQLRQGARGVVLDIETTGLPENVASGTLPKEAFQILEYSTQELAGLQPGEVHQVLVRPTQATREFYEGLIAKGPTKLTQEEIELLRNVAKYANAGWGTAALTPQSLQQLLVDTRQGLDVLESRGKPFLQAIRELQDSLADTIVVVQNAGFDLAVIRDLENYPLGRREAGIIQANQARRNIRADLRRAQDDVKLLESQPLSKRKQAWLRGRRRRIRELRAADWVARDIERGYFTYDELLEAMAAVRAGRPVPQGLPERLRHDYRWPLVDLNERYIESQLNPELSGTVGKVLARERARELLPVTRLQEGRFWQLKERQQTPAATRRWLATHLRRRALERAVQGSGIVPEDLQPRPAGAIEVLHLGTILGSGERRSLAELIQAIPGHEDIKAAYATGAHISGVDVPATAAVATEAAKMIPTATEEVRPGQIVGLVGQIQQAGQRGAYTIQELAATPEGSYRLTLAPLRQSLQPETRAIDRPITLYFGSHQEISRVIGRNLVPLADEAAAQAFEESLAADELRRRIQRASVSAAGFRRSLEFVDLAAAAGKLENATAEQLESAVDAVLAEKPIGRMYAQLRDLQGRVFDDLSAYQQFLIRNSRTIEWWWEQQRHTLHRLLGRRQERAALVDARLRELLRGQEGQVRYEFLAAVENLQAADLLTAEQARAAQKAGREALEVYLPERPSPFRKRIGELVPGVFLDVDVRTQQRAEESIIRARRQIMRRLQELQPELTYEARREQAAAVLRAQARTMGVESGNVAELARVIRERASEFAATPEKDYAAGIFAGLSPEAAAGRLTEVRQRLAGILQTTLAGPQGENALLAQELLTNYVTTGRLSPDLTTTGNRLALLRLQRAQELAAEAGGAEAGGGIRFFPHYPGGPRLVFADYPAPATRKVAFPGEEPAWLSAADLRSRLDDTRQQIVELSTELRAADRERRLELETQLEALRTKRGLILKELEERAQLSHKVMNPLAEEAREALGWASSLPAEQTMIVHGRGQGLTLAEYTGVVDHPEYDEAQRALVRRGRLQDLAERAEAYHGTFANRVQGFLRTLSPEEQAFLAEAREAQTKARLGTARARAQDIERAVSAYNEAFGIRDWLRSQALAEGVSPAERQAYFDLAGERREATPSLELAMVRRRLREQYELFNSDVAAQRQAQIAAKTEVGELFDPARQKRLQEQIRQKTALPSRFFENVTAELNRREGQLRQVASGLEAARRLRGGLTEELRFLDEMVIQGQTAEWLRYTVTTGLGSEVATAEQVSEVARRLATIREVVEGRLSPEMAGFEAPWETLSSLTDEQLTQLDTAAERLRGFVQEVVVSAAGAAEQAAQAAGRAGGKTLGEAVREAAERAEQSAAEVARSVAGEAKASALGRDLRQVAGLPDWAKWLALGVGGIYVGRSMWELSRSPESNEMLSPDRREPARFTPPPTTPRSAYVQNRQDGLSIQIRGRVKRRSPQDLDRLVANSINQTTGAGDVYVRHTDDRESLTNAWIQSLIAEATR